MLNLVNMTTWCTGNVLSDHNKTQWNHIKEPSPPVTHWYWISTLCRDLYQESLSPSPFSFPQSRKWFKRIYQNPSFRMPANSTSVQWWSNLQFQDSQVGLQVVGIFSSLCFHVTLQCCKIFWVVPARDTVTICECVHLLHCFCNTVKLILQKRPQLFSIKSRKNNVMLIDWLIITSKTRHIISETFDCLSPNFK